MTYVEVENYSQLINALDKFSIEYLIETDLDKRKTVMLHGKPHGGIIRIELYDDGDVSSVINSDGSLSVDVFSLRVHDYGRIDLMYDNNCIGSLTLKKE